MARLSQRLVGPALGTFALTALGCSQPPATAPGAIPELAGRTAGTPQHCVTIESSSALRIVNSRTVLYGNGSTIWLNRLASECPGSTTFDVLVTHPTSDQYCRGDIVQSVDPLTKVPGPTCVLGDFVPYRR